MLHLQALVCVFVAMEGMPPQGRQRWLPRCRQQISARRGIPRHETLKFIFSLVILMLALRPVRMIILECHISPLQFPINHYLQCRQWVMERALGICHHMSLKLRCFIEKQRFRELLPILLLHRIILSSRWCFMVIPHL